MTIWTKQCQKQQICGRSWAFYHSLCLSMIRASNLPQIDFPSNLIQTLHPICRRFRLFVPSSLSRKCSKAARTAAWESVWLVPVRPSTDLNMSGLVIGIFVPIWKCQNWSMVSLYWFEHVKIGNWCLWTYCNKILLILFKRKMASKGVSIDKSIRHRWSLDLPMCCESRPFRSKTRPRHKNPSWSFKFKCCHVAKCMEQ